ncbi:UbiA family prenyltransferase [bacterium]
MFLLKGNNDTNEQSYSISTFRFWKAYWITLRPYLFFISGAAGFLGITANVQIPTYKMILGFLAFFLTYGLGQALTDVFQTDTDSISSPYRPLVRGIITKKQVLGVSLTGLFMCGFIFMVFNPCTVVPAALGIVGLIFYTLFKRTWWGGPFWNSWIVATLPIIGKMLHTVHLSDLFNRYLIFGIISIFFSYAVFVLTGYLKDISADGQTGYQTIPVKFGWKPAVAVSLIYLLITCISSFMIIKDFVLGFSNAIEIVIFLIWIFSIVIFLLAHIQLLTIHENEKRAFVGIENVVRGFVLIHIAESLAFKPSLIVWGIGYYILFELIMVIRPEKTQV